MDNHLYDMVFKRKSFHLFRNIGSEKITEEELKDIENKFINITPLVKDIKVKIKIILNMKELCIWKKIRIVKRI